MPLFVIVNLQILSPREENEVASDFVLIQKLLSSTFPVEVEKGHMPSVLPSLGKPGVETSHLNAVGLANLSGHSAPQPADVIDLSSFLQDVRVTLPSLNGLVPHKIIENTLLFSTI